MFQLYKVFLYTNIKQTLSIITKADFQFLLIFPKSFKRDTLNLNLYQPKTLSKFTNSAGELLWITVKKLRLLNIQILSKGGNRIFLDKNKLVQPTIRNQSSFKNVAQIVRFHPPTVSRDNPAPSGQPSDVHNVYCKSKTFKKNFNCKLS